MMNTQIQHTALTYLLIGLMLLVGFLFFTGATSEQQVGRYRMQVVIRGNFTEIYAIDTVTGVVKWVGNDEGKPFDAIKGK